MATSSSTLRDDERNGALVKDEPVVVHCYTTPTDIEDSQNLAELGTFCKTMGRDARQGVVRDDADVDFEGKSWADLLKKWLKLVPPAGRFKTVEGQVATLQDMNAEEYVESDPLDLDHLSTGSS